MAKKGEASVEDRLRALYDLQLIDSRVDEIRNVRGELPLEVRDLEDEVEGLNTRLEKLNANLEVIDDDIKSVLTRTITLDKIRRTAKTQEMQSMRAVCERLVASDRIAPSELFRIT